MHRDPNRELLFEGGIGGTRRGPPDDAAPQGAVLEEDAVDGCGSDGGPGGAREGASDARTGPGAHAASSYCIFGLFSIRSHTVRNI